MNISLREITKNDIDDFKLIQDWDNNDNIKYLLRPNFNEKEIEDITYEEVLESFNSSEDKYMYMIMADNKEIGYIGIDTNFKMLFKEDNNTAWISICVGEDNYRGKAIGKQVMDLLEAKVKDLYKDRIELGVFEYNSIARRFYTKNGYAAIGEIKDFVYYNGKWYSDIRMEKYI